MFITEWGAKTRLVSWKGVIDEHGANVAYTALKQGTLPYVPHTLLLPGHDVPWPESHQFVMESKLWTQTWREEINFETDEEWHHTQKDMANWLRHHDPSFKADMGDLDSLMGSAKTGIPTGMESSANSAPSVAAAVPTSVAGRAGPAGAVQAGPAEQGGAVDKQISEAERRVHPAHYGPEYDKQHEIAKKNIQRVLVEWPKQENGV